MKRHTFYIVEGRTYRVWEFISRGGNFYCTNYTPKDPCVICNGKSDFLSKPYGNVALCFPCAAHAAKEIAELNAKITKENK